MTKTELIEKIHAASDKFGKIEDVYIVDDAFHACSPVNDKLWCAQGFKIEGNVAELVEVYWDFSDVPDYDDYDDASSFPWDDETVMGIGDVLQEFGLNDPNERQMALKHIGYCNA